MSDHFKWRTLHLPSFGFVLLQGIQQGFHGQRFNLAGSFITLPDLVVFRFGCTGCAVAAALEPGGVLCGSLGFGCRFALGV